MKVKDIMRPRPWVIDSIDTLGEAHEVMRTHGIRHLPVVHGGKLVGILSERDVLEYRANLGFSEDWRGIGVSGVMTRSPRTAAADDSVTEVAGRLAMTKIGALPVVERGFVLGIVTVTDVLAAEVQEAMAPSRRRTATASDVMTPGPFTGRPNESLLDVARRMSSHGIRHLPIVDDDGHVLGLLSERDLSAAVGDPSRFVLADQPSTLRVRDVMTASPRTVAEDQSIDELAGVFEDGRTDAVAVIDHGQHLVGIVSYVDALRALAADRPRA
jgi:CBS domain-containing protein